MLDLAQPEEALHEEAAIFGRADCGDAEAKTIDAAARQHGVSEPSIDRGKRQFGQMDAAKVRELRYLRQENARLKTV